MRVKKTREQKFESSIKRRAFVHRILIGAFAATAVTKGVRFTFAKDSPVDNEQMEVITVVADAILPRTSTPSAVDVHAHIFVIEFVSAGKSQEFNALFYKGLRSLKNEIENRYQKNFRSISNGEIESYLKFLLDEKRERASYWFLYRFKQLLLVGWALCKETAESAFAYSGGIYQYLPRTDSSQITMDNYIDKEYLDL